MAKLECALMVALSILDRIGKRKMRKTPFMRLLYLIYASQHVQVVNFSHGGRRTENLPFKKRRKGVEAVVIVTPKPDEKRNTDK